MKSIWPLIALLSFSAQAADTVNYSLAEEINIGQEVDQIIEELLPKTEIDRLILNLPKKNRKKARAFVKKSLIGMKNAASNKWLEIHADEDSVRKLTKETLQPKITSLREKISATNIQRSELCN